MAYLTSARSNCRRRVKDYRLCLVQTGTELQDSRSADELCDDLHKLGTTSAGCLNYPCRTPEPSRSFQIAATGSNLSVSAGVSISCAGASRDFRRIATVTTGWREWPLSASPLLWYGGF